MDVQESLFYLVLAEKRTTTTLHLVIDDLKKGSSLLKFANSATIQMLCYVFR